MLQRVLPFLFRESCVPGLLMYLVGVTYFCLLSQDEVNYETYMSENALLINHVNEKFSDYYNLKRYFNKASELYASNDTDELRRWLARELEAINLEVYHQNFTFTHGVLHSVDKIEGSNLYAIMRSPSGGRSDALLLSAPLQADCSAFGSTCLPGSLSVMLAVLRMMRTQIYWAKDVVVVFPEFEFIGFSAWINAYHGAERTPYLSWSELEGRSGSIQTGLNLELGDITSNSVDILYEGFNGLLSNLDVVNALVRITRSLSIQPFINGQSSDYRHSTSKKRVASALGLLQAVWTQAPGSATGLHGLLIGHQIPAVTVRAPSSRGSQYHKDNANPAFAKMVESLLRSMNNLQERLHQSFWFYLLPNTQRYISIGVYMPPVLLTIIGSLMLQPLALYFAVILRRPSSSLAKKVPGDSKPTLQLNKNETVKPVFPVREFDPDNNDESVVRRRTGATAVGELSDRSGVKPIPVSRPSTICTDGSLDFHLSASVPNHIADTVFWIVGSLVSGLVMHELPHIFFTLIRRKPQLLASTNLSFGGAMTASLVAVSTFFLPIAIPIAIYMLRRCCLVRIPPPSINWKSMLVLMLWTMFLACFSTLNVSASFIVSLLVIPVLLTVVALSPSATQSPTFSFRFRRVVACLLWLLVCPSALLIYASLVHQHLFAHRESAGLVNLVDQTWTQVSNWIMQSVLEADLFGCWTWPTAAFGLSTLWSLTWITLACR